MLKVWDSVFILSILITLKIQCQQLHEKQGCHSTAGTGFTTVGSQWAGSAKTP